MYLTNNASIKRYCCFHNETREKQVQVELEDDEKLIVSLLQANENQMEFGLLKIKSELSGKKMGQSHENLSSLGMTEVVMEKLRLVV
jgi:lysyl-tRNA synthetase class 2